MAKFKITLALDESKKPALERFAETIGQSDATAAATLLAAALRDPGSVFGRPSTPAVVETDGRGEAVRASVKSPTNGPSTPVVVDSDAPKPAVVDNGGSGEVDLLSSSSSSSLPPEKKKRKKTEAPSIGADEFARGWKGYAEVGGRLGSKSKAVESWNGLLATWSPDEIRRRWATVAKLTPARFLPEVHRLLRPSEGRLTDEALKSLEVRRRNETRTDPEAQGTFDTGAYEERIARARRASDPIPRPSADAIRPALAGGLPDAPQGPPVIRP